MSDLNKRLHLHLHLQNLHAFVEDAQKDDQNLCVFVEDAQEDAQNLCVFVEDAQEDAETIEFLWKTLIAIKNIVYDLIY